METNNFSSREDKVYKLYTDMYVGNGLHNPSITTRLTMTEDKIDRIGKNLNKALWLAASTLILLIGEFALKLIR